MVNNDVLYDGGMMNEDQIKVREQAIKILYKSFGQDDKIYLCADEWVAKGQKSCFGIVKYYDAYFTGKYK